jgi:hypothetical protein
MLDITIVQNKTLLIILLISLLINNKLINYKLVY